MSTARLATYRAVARDDEHAWELYRWNLELAAAFTPLACDVEVALRNCIHGQLTNHFGSADWWAATRAVDYEAILWRPALRLGFTTGTFTPKGPPRRPTRDAVHQRASSSATEKPVGPPRADFAGVPIAGTTQRIGIVDLWNQSLELLEWISPDLAAEDRVTARVPQLFAARP